MVSGHLQVGHACVTAGQHARLHPNAKPPTSHLTTL